MALGIVVWSCGCTPQHYRLRADRETYDILAEKSQGPQWQTPPFSVQAPPESRNADPFCPDHAPVPPDDPAAHRYMHWVDGKWRDHRWDGNRYAPWIEDPTWKQYLPVSEEGELDLDRDTAVLVGLLHSRDYLFELENLYLSALTLTLERFEFDLQWFGRNATTYEHFGTGGSPNESNTLTIRSNLGFSKAFAAGGQLLVDFANTLVWEFTGANSHISMSNIAIRLVQPLLRGAGRDIRLESLTQVERDVLYDIRDFARFRKQFYFDIVSGNAGYLSLLLRLQAIRNQEANLESLEQNLRAHEALSDAGIVSPLQVDQVFQRYQRGQLRLIQARNGLETALDNFKIQLGLPPELEIELDDEVLGQFELNSPELVRIEEQFGQILVMFRERDEPPPRDQIDRGFEDLKTLHERLLDELTAVSEEFERWKNQPADSDAEQPEDRELEAQQTVANRLKDLRQDLEEAGRNLDAAADAATDQPITEAWEAIQANARQESAQVSDLLITQTQIRIFLIRLPTVDLERDEAIEIGLATRLDLMNRRAEVVDAWRKVHVAANGLEADLDLVLEGDIATAPGTKNPVKFQADASRYRAGVRLDGPLNRRLERNIYRAELIEYQRARRAFISSRDDVVRAIRLDLRNLEADRLNFEITRQSLVVAARQVELARIQLLAPGQTGDSSTTQDVLNALNDLLDAKNALIGIWIRYETDRLQLLLDTELLQLDERGLHRDDDSNNTQLELVDTPPGEPDVTAAP